MDHLWSPWRYTYVSSAAPEGECLFCRIASESDDRKNYVILREQRTFALLNRYPYTSGHLMIAPYAHVATLEDADPHDLEEVIRLARRQKKRCGRSTLPADSTSDSTSAIAPERAWPGTSTCTCCRVGPATRVS